MQQAEILSIVEHLLPAYHAADFETVLDQVVGDHSPTAKLLVKMEMNRLMSPCTKKIDLRGRVQGECREFTLDGIQHWLDDVAFNAYHKNIKKYGSYTEGVWEAMVNTRNNYRVMTQNNRAASNPNSVEEYQFSVESVHLGFDLKRKENRLKVASQVEMKLSQGQQIHAVTVDLSDSGAKFKVPTAFNYKLGEVIDVYFVELAKGSKIEDVDNHLDYRVVGIDQCYENDAVKYLRTIKLSPSDLPDRLIREALKNTSQRVRHDNQDKIIRARTRGYEHTFLKHTCNLPIFFSKNELKLVLMTENNKSIWQYWQDERNQQALSSLFSKERMSLMAQTGVKSTSNILYSFKHKHQDKSLFYSMMVPEANREERKLFWHVGARRASWKVFKLHVFELDSEEREELARHTNELNLDAQELTHCGVLQELADTQSARDYLLSEKPLLDTKVLNKFRQSRATDRRVLSLYFDACTRRREPRYKLRSPIFLSNQSGQTVEGVTTDISKHGLGVILKEPVSLIADEMCQLNFKELQLYDKSLPLSKVSYQAVRVGSTGKQIQLKLEYNTENSRVAAFFEKVIRHNEGKLIEKNEILPSNAILEGLHNILLDKVVSAPLFFEKQNNNIKPRVIGINQPLADCLMPFARLGGERKFVLDPIFKGRTNTLIAQPMKRIDGAGPHYFEVYVHSMLLNERTQRVQTRLSTEFDSVKERLHFIKKAQTIGRFFALRISSAPVFDPITSLLRKDIDELISISLTQARNLEKEILGIVGYSEVVDVTDEVLVRLELTR
ncbi:PilZ domain-containing protein [Vibrio astriarenae]|uniref:PilZ domain-containing protein n=1 Tax=Vibrio astriarenae TaxID=1481923 RepID=UPI0037361383